MMINQWKTVLALVGVTLAVPLLQAQKQPQPKSQKEIQALQAVQAAKTPDEQLKAIDSVLENFADTEYKPMLLQFAMQACQQKNDYACLITYGERVLEVDPKNIVALSTMALQIVGHVRENDLDKEENLAKAEKYAKATLAAAPDAPKPNPNITDEQWASAKKDFESDAHAAMGQAALLRKKYDDAIAEYKKAQETWGTPNAVVVAHLGEAYLSAGKYDEAIAAFDQATAMPQASPQVKSYVAAKKADAVKRKGAGAAAPPAAPPGQVEIKK